MHLFKQTIEQEIHCFLQQWQGPADLKDICAYALGGPAKRYRPLLLHLIADTICKDADVLQAALAVELWHTASLIADDLPCMDDDRIRRGKAAVHEKFGEAKALLASYAMIAAGYGCLANNLRNCSSQVGYLALSCVCKNTGAAGATGGQYLDLFSPQDKIEEMMIMKTGALFELSFVLGWLLANGDPNKLPLVELAAKHYGMIFQLQDDLEDACTDKIDRNYVLLFGRQATVDRLSKEIEALQSSLDQLDLSTLMPVLVPNLVLA